MRLIDADAFDKCLEDAEDKAIHMQKYVFASALNTIRGNLRTFPAIEPEREKMADLIDRQAEIDALDCINGVEEAQRSLPSIQPEQPEIIRCKDCKHVREGGAYLYCDKLYGMGILNVYDCMTAEDDYCGMAERRADGPD